jgi:hypothetical protein
MASPDKSGDGKTSPFGDGAGNAKKGSEMAGGYSGTQPDLKGVGKATMDAFAPPKPQPRGNPDIQEYGAEAGTDANPFKLVGSEHKQGVNADAQPTGSSGQGPGKLPVKNLK